MANLFKSANKNPNKKRDINIVIKTTTVVLSVLAFFIITAKTTLAEPVYQQWTQRYDNGYDAPHAIAVDNQGNTYIAIQEGDNINITISYDPNGNVRWQHTMSQSYSQLTLDNIGNVYVTGLHWAGYGSGYNWITIKYNGVTGEQMWYQDYDLPGTGATLTTGIKTDNDNNLYIIGRGTTQSNYMLKYSTDGEVLWGLIPSCESVSMDIDSENNIYVTGDRDNGGMNVDYCTRKYDSEGNLLWQMTYNGPGDIGDYARSIAVDSLGNAYVTGSLGMHMYQLDISSDIGTIKYDTNGNLMWMRHYGQSEIDTGEGGIDVEVDPFGNVVVSGRTSTTGSPTWNTVWTTIKYNSNGDTIWLNNLAGPILTGYQAPADMEIDNDGYIYITGNFYTQNNGQDIKTIKYNLDGEMLWDMRYDGPTHYNDGGTGIVVDSNKNAYVIGYMQENGSMHTITIKYTPSIDVTVTPNNPPIIIPQSGGTFNYDITLTNNGTENQNFDIWTEITTPTGHNRPIFGPVNINMPSTTTINRNKAQTIPANLPIGIYTFTVKAGNYLEDIWSSDSFTFEIQ